MTAKKLMAVVLACVVAACSDGGTGPSPQEAARFTADQASYAQYQVAVLTLNGTAPTAQMHGTLGAEALTLMPLGDSSVVFMVPAVTGAQTLTFTAGSSEYEGTITVTALESVPEPETYLAEVSLDAEALIDGLEAEMGADTLEHAIPHDMLAAARDSLESFRLQVAQLTPAEAQQVADILSANLDRMSTLGDESALMAGVVHATAAGMIPVQCQSREKVLERYTCTWRAFGTHMTRAALGLTTALLAAEALSFVPVLAGPVAALLAGIGCYEAARAVRIGGELILIHGLAAWEVTKAVYEAGAGYFQTHIVSRFDGSQPGPAGMALLDASAAPAAQSAFRLASSAMPPTSMTTVTNGRPMTFTIAPQLRNVQATDSDLPFSWLAAGLKLIDAYNRRVSSFDTDWQIEFASLTTQYADPVDADEITIEIVGESTVRVDSIARTADRMTVKFGSSDTGIQEFQYDVVYDSGVYPEVRVRYDAELHPPGYIITDRAFNEVPDTLTVVVDFGFHLYPLLDNDGSLIPDAETPIIQNAAGPWQTGVNVSTGAFIHEEQTYSAVTFSAFNYDPGVYSDTVDVDITVDTGNGNFQPLRTLTFVVDDSTKMYHRSAAGRWVQTNYHINGGGETVTTFVLNEDGTGEVLSIVFNGESEPVPDREFGWNITMGFTASDTPVPNFRISWSGGVLWGRGPVTYPVQSFSGETSVDRWSATKQ